MCIQISDKFTITEEKIKQYAHLSGDDNVIHLERSEAVGWDFKAPIAHGILVMGLVTDIASRFTQEGMIIFSYKMRFLKPVYQGETIEIAGEAKWQTSYVHLWITGEKISGKMKLGWSSQGKLNNSS